MFKGVPPIGSTPNLNLSAAQKKILTVKISRLGHPPAATIDRRKNFSARFIYYKIYI
jgi:hypothetical protein